MKIDTDQVIIAAIGVLSLFAPPIGCYLDSKLKTVSEAPTHLNNREPSEFIAPTHLNTGDRIDFGSGAMDYISYEGDARGSSYFFHLSGNRYTKISPSPGGGWVIEGCDQPGIQCLPAARDSK